jgi:S-DNA-T family DNA segregation ATPase FtsK/SpoIIIE
MNIGRTGTPIGSKSIEPAKPVRGVVQGGDHDRIFTGIRRSAGGAMNESTTAAARGYETMTEGFGRRPRLAPPRAPGGEVAMQAPPEVPRTIPGGLLMKLLPVVLVIAVVGMLALMFTSGASAMASPLMMMFPLMMLVSMVGMYGGGNRSGGPRPAELNEDRKDYLRYLAQVRERVAQTRSEQRAALEWIHPAPAVLGALIGGPRMWERRIGDPDHLHLRVGVGTQRLATRLVPPETGPVEDLEPVSTVALRRFVRRQATVPALPIAVAVRGFPAVGVDGAANPARALIRSMLLGAAVLHGPDHMRIAIVTPEPESPRWQWAKWLPHTAHPVSGDALGPLRMLFPTIEELDAEVTGQLSSRGVFDRAAIPEPGSVHWLIVLDVGVEIPAGSMLDVAVGLDGVTVIDLLPAAESLAARHGLRLVLAGPPDAPRLGAVSAAGPELFAVPDALTCAAAEITARRLARYRPASVSDLLDFGEVLGPTDPGLMSLLGISDAATVTPNTVWRERVGPARLKVPIGTGERGEPIELDMKEAAESGMGPHGLCIGATGSGKSEFLRTLVLSLTATHSPEQLNLVLVDFKGGATFLGFERLRHTAAVITNLEAELAMVDRMRDALSGEMNRRQELLRAAGNFANVGEYERARRGGADLPPLPALLVIVDEFSELLAQKPDFAELFVAIGRLGRSLHMHLLLASQRLEEGKLRGLDSHLSYRIGLKTFSANESRAVLGVPDAYHLPATPGAGYLKCDADPPRRFHAAYVSGPYRPPRAAAGRAATVPAGTVRRFTVGRVPIPDQPLVGETEVTSGAPLARGAEAAPSVLETVVTRLAGHGPAAHEVWLPPLDAPAAVADLADALTAAGVGPLNVALGVVDRPYDQRRDVLVADLSGARGNVAVIGGPQSGKSMALRSLILGAALTHGPRQTQFYVLDFGGGSLVGLAGLPHVGVVAGRMDPDRVRRTVAEVVGVIRRREVAFHAAGVESMTRYREHPMAAEDPFGDVFLVIDGWAVLRSEFEALEQQVIAIAAQGLSFGVHLVIAAARWGEIRAAVKDQLGTRVELRLGDPMDSEMGRAAAGAVPVGRPGRGLSPERLHMLIALPRADGGSSAADLPAAQAAAVAEIAARYTDRAPAVRLLPERVLLDAVPRPDSPPTTAVVGLAEQELAPALLDFAAQPLLLIFGDAECGKTQTLRTIAASLTTAGSPQQSKIVLIDYRRTLLGALAEDHLGGYATSPEAATALLAELAALLNTRRPGPAITPAELRARSWWTGPDVYLMVDDYDLVASAAGNPLLVLAELLPQARDVGLKVILARRSGGLARGMFEPFLARVRDLAADGLVMSGNRDEGMVLGAVRMRALPPGRGTLVSRAHGVDEVQVALVDDPD